MVPGKVSFKRPLSRLKILIITLFVILMVVIFSTIAALLLSPPPRDWWIGYPDGHVEATREVDHPDWIIGELDKYDAVVLFFWQVGCDPTEKQWNDMEDSGLVKGSMDGGGMDRYSDDSVLFSLDINKNDIYLSALHTYDPEGSLYGTPTTVILTKLPEGDIGWYSYKGIMDTDDLDYYIDNAINYESSSLLIAILTITIIALVVAIVVLVIFMVTRKGK